MKKIIVVGICTLALACGLSVTSIGIIKNSTEKNVAKAENSKELQTEKTNIATVNDGENYGIYCKDTITNINEEKKEDLIDEIYDDIDEKYIEEAENSSVAELKDDIDEFDQKYEVGDKLSDEDAAKLIYACKMYKEEKEDNNAVAELCAWVTHIHNIGNTVSKHGLTTSYKGSFNIWSGLAHGRYDTDVKVKITKGKNKLKSMKWTTYHRAYGLLGTSGSSPSLGVTYSGSHSSNKYKSNFHFEHRTTYTGIGDAYHSTWGKLKVNHKDGEYTMNTKTYSHFE